MSSSPTSVVHTKVPITQITPSTIVLGSACAINDISSASSFPLSHTLPSSSSVSSTPVSTLESPSSANKEESLVTSPSSSSPLFNSSHTMTDEPVSIAISTDPPERCTSPRRDSITIEKVGREKLHVLRKEAQLIQDSLTDILDRVVKVKEDYDRLSSENKFLQDYIGNLMSTSNILNKATG